jgi:uncharacterized OsmC-like protein
MSVKVQRIEGFKFTAKHEGHEIISGRTCIECIREGMSPGRLMTASLGLCSALHAAWYLYRHNITAKDLSVDVSSVNASAPSRAISFDVTVNVDAPSIIGRGRVF